MLVRIFIFLLPSILLLGNVDFADFKEYQGKLTRSELESRLEKYLQKGEKLSEYFSLDDKELVLYTASRNEKERTIEYRIALSQVVSRAKKLRRPRHNLVGVRVAIDPGHLGGKYAHLEKRFIDLHPSIENEERIQFDEGTLSFLTASYLKILLEKEGAIVMLTKNAIGEGALETDFFAWLKSEPELWAGDQTLSQLFRRYYNPLDMHARAEKINAFGPDVTVVIHYNCERGDDGRSANYSVSSKNYNLTFVPGAFCAKELSDRESRYEFLRLLLSEDQPRSIALSQSILEQFTQALDVPPVKKEGEECYLGGVCMEMLPGVYARNLALTRLVHSPLCYGETLIQNNIDESQNLARTDFVIGGQRCSSRITQVAQAYFEGIKQYILD